MDRQCNDAHALLRRACRAHLEQAPDPALRALCDDAALSAAFPAIAANRLWQPVERGLALSGVAIPRDSESAFRAARGRAALCNLRLIDLAARTLPLLAGGGIRAVVFKGPLFNRQLHGDAFFRAVSDLDILVPRKHFARAVGVLRDHGFRTGAGQASRWWRHGLGEVHLRHPTGGTIDLHHRVQQPGCPLARNSVEFLRAVPEMQEVGGTLVPVVRPRIALLLAALNLVKGLMQRKPSGDYALDVAAGARSLDASELAQLGAFAEAQGLLRSMKFALAVTGETFGIAFDLPAILRPEPGKGPGVPSEWPLAAMVLQPDAPRLAWPRRRRLLWAMSEGRGPVPRAANYARDAAQALGSEALRIATSLPVFAAPAAPATAR